MCQVVQNASFFPFVRIILWQASRSKVQRNPSSISYELPILTNLKVCQYRSIGVVECFTAKTWARHPDRGNASHGPSRSNKGGLWAFGRMDDVITTRRGRGQKFSHAESEQEGRMRLFSLVQGLFTLTLRISKFPCSLFQRVISELPSSDGYSLQKSSLPRTVYLPLELRPWDWCAVIDHSTF